MNISKDKICVNKDNFLRSYKNLYQLEWFWRQRTEDQSESGLNNVKIVIFYNEIGGRVCAELIQWLEDIIKEPNFFSFSSLLLSLSSSPKSILVPHLPKHQPTELQGEIHNKITITNYFAVSSLSLWLFLWAHRTSWMSE